MTPSPHWLLISPSSMRFVIIIFTTPCPPTQMPTNQTRPPYISLAQRDKNALTVLQLTDPISCVLEICLNILGPASIHHCESLVINTIARINMSGIQSEYPSIFQKHWLRKVKDRHKIYLMLACRLIWSRMKCYHLLNQPHSIWSSHELNDASKTARRISTTQPTGS